MKNLLAAVDLSETSNFVVATAAELAKQLSAKIVLLHVVEPVRTHLPVESASGPVVATAWPLQTPKELKERLNSLASPLKEAGIAVEPRAHVGLVAEDIVQQAVDCDAEFIILGCPEHFPPQRPYKENIFTGVLSRQPPCPVIVVPAKASP